MILSVIGDTDKRPFVYTILKVCQALGDVLLVTNNRHYARLIEEPEEDVDAIAGHFQNTMIVVTDMTPDEASEVVGYNAEDYEYIIYDNQLDAEGDLTLYIAGCDMSDREKEFLEYLEDGVDYHTIRFGFGKKNVIPYTAKMFQACEIVEGKHLLVPVDAKITSALCKLLADSFGMPAKNLEKVVNKK